MLFWCCFIAVLFYCGVVLFWVVLVQCVLVWKCCFGCLWCCVYLRLRVLDMEVVMWLSRYGVVSICGCVMWRCVK